MHFIKYTNNATDVLTPSRTCTAVCLAAFIFCKCNIICHVCAILCKLNHNMLHMEQVAWTKMPQIQS